jgi:hypothetical protein
MLVAAALAGVIAGAFGLVSMHQRPTELLDSARAVVPAGWTVTSEYAEKGDGLGITLNAARVAARPPEPLPGANAVNAVRRQLDAKGCHPHLSPVVLWTPTVLGRCGVTDFQVDFSGAPRGDGTFNDNPTFAIEILTKNADGMLALRAALYTAAVFLAVAVLPYAYWRWTLPS